MIITPYKGQLNGCAYIENESHIIDEPTINESERKTTKIVAENILVLKLNRPFAYGHIYTDVLPELYAVEEMFPEYDCILIEFSKSIKNKMNFFNLKISDKIKFISATPHKVYLLNFQRLDKATPDPQRLAQSKNILNLKAAFHRSLPIINTPKPFVLFCSRTTTGARGGRNITRQNENEVVEHLKQYAEENNLEFYFLTGQEPDGSCVTLAKQYELFSNAKIVVGPHGGAFSNLIFLDPAKKPKVIEFCPHPYKSFKYLSDHAFETFAEYCQIPYILPHEVESEIKHVTDESRKCGKITKLIGQRESSVDLRRVREILTLK